MGAGVVLLAPLSPVLIFGFGAIPAMGIAGGGVAVLITTALTGAGLAWYLWSGRRVVHPKLSHLRKALFVDILRVGAVGSVNTLQTTLVMVLAFRLTGSLTALFASLALGLVVYGVSLMLAIRAGVWFDRDQGLRPARTAAA